MRSPKLLRPLLALAAVAPSFACGGSTQPVYPVTASKAPSANLEAVITFIEGQMTSCNIPGAAIAVVENGKLTDFAGIGVEDPATGKPVSASTLFHMGGASEPLVDLTALALARQGKLDLSAPITQYVPLELAAGFDPSSVTLDQVLLGTSGLPEGQAYPCGPSDSGAWFEANASLPLWSPPGAVWNFSHLGYNLFGWVIESASSQTYADAAQTLVLGPAGMTRATYDFATASNADHALGQTVDPTSGQVTPNPPEQAKCALDVPTGALWASVLDYASLAETLLAGGGSMLDAASVTKFETPQVDNYQGVGHEYAYGMWDEEEEFEGVRVLDVGGSPTGFSTEFWLVPSRGFAVAVFFNAQNAGDTCSSWHAAELATQTYLSLKTIPWSDPSSGWAPFVGTYVDPLSLGQIDVTLAGNQLSLTTTSPDVSLTLTPVSGTAFNATFEGKTVTVSFQPDDSGPGGWFVSPYGVGKRQR